MNNDLAALRSEVVRLRNENARLMSQMKHVRELNARLEAKVEYLQAEALAPRKAGFLDDAALLEDEDA